MTTAADMTPSATGPTMSTVRSTAVVFAVLAAVYLSTATYYGGQILDSALTAISSWSIVTQGSLDVSEALTQLHVTEVVERHLVETDAGTYTNRFPGPIFLGVPFYWLADLITVGAPHILAPGGFAAAIIAAAAMAILHLVFRRIADPRTAMAAAVAFGLGTATWSVSANVMLTHGPAQLWLALGMLALASGRHASSGLAWGLALFTRPHLGVVAATTGIYESARTRSVLPAVRVAATTAAGLAGWLIYGRLLVGHWTLLGGYSQNPQLADSLSSQTPVGMMINLFWMLVHPLRGVLPYSPFLFVLLPAVPRVWRNTEPWVRSSAIAGVLYLLAQAYINRWSGGDTYWGYRYQVETLTLMAPLLLAAFLSLPRERQRFAIVLVVGAVVLQFPGAVLGLVV